MLWCIAAGAQTAGRELHWDALDVEARLNADGVLDVIERHTMVFTGDWNGGERVFNVRPRQKLEFLGLERIDARTGSPQPLQETSVPDNVDEFAWTDRRTLRWRSRLPSDPPFANTRLAYVLRYRLSGVLLERRGRAVSDRSRLRISQSPRPDRALRAESGSRSRLAAVGEFQNRYSAGPLEPGRSFVLNIPLRYSGSVVAGGHRHQPSDGDCRGGDGNLRGLCTPRSCIRGARAFPRTIRTCRHDRHRQCMD